jgi:aryl-alcohol dehydrogenase-like predicted oxidoreductase
VRARIALGTVQFGLPYGIANRAGQVAHADVAAILAYARSAGVDTVDTAIAYGDSEKCLGDVGMQSWRVVSKLPPVPSACRNVETWVQQCISGSLERLAVSQLYGVLLHKPLELLGEHGKALYEGMLSLKRRSVVQKIGISVYGPDDLDALWPHFELDLVQAPFNVFDRRLAESGWLRRLHASGTEVHTRSAFLQGLLLMNAADRPVNFRRWQPLWDAWQRWLEVQKLSALEACLGFALSHREISRVIVGVDSLLQLQQILAHVETAVGEVPDALSCKDLDLVDPSKWDSA